MKVSVPLLNQLIWPGAVNAAVLMKAKSWLPATVSSASMLVKWARRPAQCCSRRRCPVVQANLVDGRPQEPVGAAVAAQRIDAEAADEDVDAVIADDDVVKLVAGQSAAIRLKIRFQGVKSVLAEA